MSSEYVLFPEHVEEVVMKTEAEMSKQHSLVAWNSAPNTFSTDTIKSEKLQEAGDGSFPPTLGCGIILSTYNNYMLYTYNYLFSNEAKSEFC